MDSTLNPSEMRNIHTARNTIGEMIQAMVWVLSIDAPLRTDTKILENIIAILYSITHSDIPNATDTESPTHIW